MALTLGGLSMYKSMWAIMRHWRWCSWILIQNLHRVLANGALSSSKTMVPPHLKMVIFFFIRHKTNFLLKVKHNFEINDALLWPHYGYFHGKTGSLKNAWPLFFFLFIAVFQDNFISFLFRKNVTSITVACETGNWANESFLPIYYISLKLANELTENISLDLMYDHWLGMIKNIDSFAGLEITAKLDGSPLHPHP